MNEYHYTLYYYDQSGNLTQTVPPEGVDFLNATEQEDQATYRYDGTGSPQETYHMLKTRYYYNTLNQLIKQYTPDGDTTQFWYDRLGRIVASQNARQRLNDQYSFTVYDNLGRIQVTGQLEQSTEMTFAIAMDNSDLANWIDAGTSKREMSTTYYDNEALPVGIHFTNSEQTNLRNRISSVTWETEDDEDSLTYDYATHYSYDVSGNVYTLIQELGGLRGTGNDFKRMDYEYDLVSGKVNQVSYQPDSADQFYYEYIYDDDNRLVNALTSIDEHLWQNEATYLYYKHGPLRRTEIGERQVQGMDFAYTIQGWLKGMNSEGRDQGKDMGGDGKTSGSHKLFGRDVASFVLSYFEGDYKPIGPNRFTATYSTGGGFGASSPSLYNGNIRKATYSLANLSDPVAGYAYGYDQLNRLISMDAWFNFNTGSYAWQTSGSASNKLQERVSYDGNGNITKYLRKGYSPTNMDSLTYKYYPKSNKLLRVDDAIGDVTYADIDVDDQDNDNYEYDLTGNLVKDSIEGISLITWNLMGKVDSIARYGSSSRPELKFLYDAMGNRVGKIVYDGSDVTKTWYIRDAQGNIMATYEEENDTLTWEEQHIYGSSRLGYWQPDSIMFPKPTLPATDTFRYHVKAGDKLYEIANHLGNVLASITDRKIPQETGTPNGIADYYLADIATVQDYYPFGMVMPGRNWTAGSADGYGYGFNGKIKDDEIKGNSNSNDFGARLYDNRICNWLSIDPLTSKFAGISPYASFNNNPLVFIDDEGRANMVYIYFLPNSETNLTQEDRQAIIKEAQRIYSEVLKIDIKVVEYSTTKNGDFDSKHMDPSDAVVFVGDPALQGLCDLASASVADESQFDTWDNFNQKNNPERSENTGGDGSISNPFGQVVAINSTTSGDYGDYGANSIGEYFGYLVVHGTGHNASIDHQGFDESLMLYVPSTSIMAEGQIVYDTANKIVTLNSSSENKNYETLTDFVNSPDNADLKEQYQKKFNAKASSDNYLANKTRSTPGFQEPCGQPTMIEVQN